MTEPARPTNGHAGRVSLSEERVKVIVNEALQPYPTRRELLLTVSVALLGGQAVAALIAGYNAKTPVQHASMAVWHALMAAIA